MPGGLFGCHTVDVNHLVVVVPDMVVAGLGAVVHVGCNRLSVPLLMRVRRRMGHVLVRNTQLDEKECRRSTGQGMLAICVRRPIITSHVLLLRSKAQRSPQYP